MLNKEGARTGKSFVITVEHFEQMRISSGRICKKIVKK